MFKDAVIEKMSLDEIIENSGKMQVLDALLTKFKAEGHKVLIYTQMLRTMQILAQYCKAKQYKFQSLLGTNSVEARARAIGQFNKSDSEDFIFLLTTKQGKQGINLQTASKVIIFDVDFSGTVDLQAIGKTSKFNACQIDIYRLVTRDSVEARISEIMKRKMAFEQSQTRYQLDNTEKDVSVLKHILETGTKSLCENKLSQPVSADQSIQKAEKLNYNQLTESDISRLDYHFNDFKQFYEMFWSQTFPEPSADSYEPNDFTGSLSQQQFNTIVQGILNFGSWRFADKVQSGLSQDDTAAAMFSIIKMAKQTIAEFGNDVFNLPATQNFTY